MWLHESKIDLVCINPLIVFGVKRRVNVTQALCSEDVFLPKLHDDCIAQLERWTNLGQESPSLSRGPTNASWAGPVGH